MRFDVVAFVIAIALLGRLVGQRAAAMRLYVFAFL